MDATTLYSYFTIVIQMFYQTQYVVRIIGGRNPAPNENNYVVSFQAKSNHYKIYGSGHFCGGVILNSEHILSAAHCFDNKEFKDILALVGIYNLYIEKKAVLDSDIKRIVLHEKFTRNDHSNDIAIVHLKKKIPDYKSRIIPLHLKQFTNPTNCHLLGWGQIYDNGPRTDVLYAIDFITRDMNVCFMDDAKKTKLMICVGSVNNSYACHGDSGGPLICNNQIAGILSHGWGCEPFAFVFTRVSYYNEWILRGSVIRNQYYHKFFLIFISVLMSKYI